MTARNEKLLFLILLTAFCLASCGGGSSESASGGGIGGTGYVSTGSITAFGSIWVNGVEFDTVDALIILSGQSAGKGNQAVLENLALGKVVVVEGNANEEASFGSASRVSYSPNVKGPISKIVPLDSFSLKITVLGQTVIVDEKTLVPGTAAGALTVNNFVEVSGLQESRYGIRATYLKKWADTFPPSSEVEVKGIVQDPDLAGKTFKLGGLLVDYRRANLLSRPGSEPADGQWVRVKGKLGTGSVLAAAEVEPSEENILIHAQRLDVEGFVTDFISASDFRVGSVKIQVDGNTRFFGGRIEELGPDVRIRARGRFSNGVLFAQQIIFYNQIELQSRISSIDSSKRTLALRGLEKITVNVTGLTKIVPATDEFDELRVGDSVKVRGYARGKDSMVAARLQVIPSIPAGDLTILQGPVEEISKPNLVILGVTVDTTAIANEHFEGLSESDKRAEFFRNLQAGDLVKVRGRAIGTNQVLWEGISLERGS